MKIAVQQIEKSREEEVRILCHEVSCEIEEIIRFVKSKDLTLPAYGETAIHQILLRDIFYVEAVNNRVFAYLEKEVYELRMKLYEFEELSESRRFFRCAKSVIVNLMKMESIRPALNSRFAAKMTNGEEVIISRQYVSALRQKLGGE